MSTGLRTRRAALLSLVGLGTGAALTGPDVSSLFADAPAGPSQSMTFRQGTIISFDQNTLANQVRVGNSTMINLPLLGVAEASSLAAGATVGVVVVGDDTAAKTMFIIGRSVIPATPDATNAITLVGQNIITDFIAAQETTTSGSFTDLATIGPTVLINVRASGKALVFLGCTCANSNGGGPAAGALWGAFMNFITSGANTLGVQPGGLGYHMAGVTGGGPFSEFSIARMIPLNGLTPGLTQFQAKYACDLGVGGETARFRNRSMAVFAL